MTVTAVRPKSGAAPDEAAPTGGSKKKLILVAALVGVLGAAGWFFFMRPAGAEAGPEPGEVVALEPIQVNLAGGHYLRVGIALQLTTKAHEVDGSQALDTLIAVFSGHSMEEVNQPKVRESLREDLVKKLEKRYEEGVMGVYFTEYVTQ